MSFIGYISVLFAWRAVTIKVRLYSVAVHHASEMPPVWLFSIVTVYTLLKPFLQLSSSMLSPDSDDVLELGDSRLRSTFCILHARTTTMMTTIRQIGTMTGIRTTSSMKFLDEAGRELVGRVTLYSTSEAEYACPLYCSLMSYVQCERMSAAVSVD